MTEEGQENAPTAAVRGDRWLVIPLGSAAQIRSFRPANSFMLRSRLSGRLSAVLDGMRVRCGARITPIMLEASVQVGIELGGRYILEELLDSGGMGNLWRGTDRKLACG